MHKLLVPAVLLMLSACSGADEEAGSGEQAVKDSRHVWESMTDRIDKSREVGDTLLEAHARERQMIEEQTR